MNSKRWIARRPTLVVFFVTVTTVVTLALWQPPADEKPETLTSREIEEAKPLILDAQATVARQDNEESGADELAPDKRKQNRDDGNSAQEAPGGLANIDAGAGGEEKGEGDGQAVQLTEAQLRDFGIEVAIAGPGTLPLHIERPAEVKFNGDRVVHVVPRVGGIVSEVLVSQGEYVTKGTPMAVLNSRELAEAKALYLADFERRNLASQTFERESRLWEKKISSEKDYLDAKTALAEAEIALRASGQKLMALGFSRQFLDSLIASKDGDADLTRYEIIAPITGNVIERHASLGESAPTDKELFVLADTSEVWVDVTIYPKDLALVRAGQSVNIDFGDGNPITSKIAFVTPEVREETRTGIARVITDSAGGRIRPGMFAKAQVEIGDPTVAVRIPKAAIQSDDEHSAFVFVQKGNKFEPRPVELGAQDRDFVEVKSGLNAGEAYVSKGAFTLKAELSKGSFAEE